MPTSNPSQPGRDPGRAPFTTIDDAYEKAQELAAMLGQLSEYKHPLDIRKARRRKREGVSDIAKDQDSKQLKGSGRTYFFDIKETKQDTPKPYLVITESRKGRGEQFERSRINVFPEDAKAFAQAVSEMVKKLG